MTSTVKHNVETSLPLTQLLYVEMPVEIAMTDAQLGNTESLPMSSSCDTDFRLQNPQHKGCTWVTTQVR